ncbi:dihydroxyacetone kinase subunit DhaK [Actinomyces howellii]|uniref:dihydroxyacetone kinase subunit DhaK n=1 Tax=Actinomyces howellii TaxID=52771 RepID=UPI001E3B9B75|nr:dihydroxyacetone kinase subunit DhaK [Actinomyces howellii]
MRRRAAAHPDTLRADLDQRVVYRRHPKTAGEVALVSGGGSGHRPLRSGVVGPGVLHVVNGQPVVDSAEPGRGARVSCQPHEFRRFACA